MEIFIEEMVKKKKTTADYLMAVTVSVLAGVVAFVAVFRLSVFSMVGTIIFFLAAGLVYGAYILVTSINVEYEYSLVNTEMDVDKIINKTKRKRVTTVAIRGLEAFGTKKNADYGRYLNNSAVNKKYACIDKNAEDVFFVVFNEGAEKIMLIFNPSEKIIDQIAKRNPQKQFN